MFGKYEIGNVGGQGDVLEKQKNIEGGRKETLIRVKEAQQMFNKITPDDLKKNPDKAGKVADVLGYLALALSALGIGEIGVGWLLKIQDIITTGMANDLVLGGLIAMGGAVLAGLAYILSEPRPARRSSLN